MARSPLQESCSRCGRRDQPGHGCDRRWEVPKWIKFGPFDPWGIQHSGFKRSDGSVSHLSWQLHWKWRGDVHHFTIRPSLGSHTNVSERSRRDRRERELQFEFAGWPDDEPDIPPSEVVRRAAEETP